MKRHLLALAVLTTACASVPVSSPGERTFTEAERCLAVGPCTVVQVENRNFYDAVIYLNGAKIGEATGNGPRRPLFIRDSELRDGRCAIVVIRLVGPRNVAQTTKECVEPGGHYELTIEPNAPLHAWLNPRPAPRR